MALPTFNTKSPTIKRILKEASELSAHPDPTLHAAPLDSNLFEWHFTIAGPPTTPYSKGVYHGRIVLPPTYPLRPPSFRFLTPSGRFEVNREICLSISGHHEETWQPAWGIRTALWALRAFMEGDAKGQVGGMEMQQNERERLAGESRAWKCQGCGGRSNEDILKEEGSGAGEGKSTEHAVPEELRFGFRDHMGESEDGKTADVEREQSQPEGTPAPGLTASTINLGAPEAPADLQETPLPPPPYTGSVPTQPTIGPIRAPHSIPTATTPNGVPPWVDKAITGLVAALAVMVFKKIVL